ncbi:MAG: hypothetical protein ACYTEI_14455 [Planctomycetota bacterium]|jgi:hypothetical protein
MSCRPTARLAVIVGAGVVLAAATYTEAGSRVRGQHGLRRSSNFQQRFYQARSDLRCRNAYAGSRHLGFGREIRDRHQFRGRGFLGCSALAPKLVPVPNFYGYGYDRLTRSESAWILLADGKARAALREFAVLALRSSGNAEARAGYGLASAVLGKHDTAAWAFRRAVTADADVLDDLAGDERLTEPLRQILDEYARQLQGGEAELAQGTALAASARRIASPAD